MLRLDRGGQKPELSVFDQLAAALLQLDLAALTTRASACVKGRMGWVGLDAAAGVAPPPTAAEIAAEVFKASVLASMR